MRNSYANTAVFTLVAAITLLCGLACRTGGPVETKGKDLFMENCAACHMHEGRVGPRLKEHAGYFVDAGVPSEMLGKIFQHPVRVPREDSTMPAFSQDDLSDEDLDAIGLYLAGFTPQPQSPIDLGSAERGAPLYEENCAFCHGEQGEGEGGMLAVAPFAERLRQLGAQPNAMLAYVFWSARSGEVEGMVEYSEEELSDQDLADLAAFIWSMPQPHPSAEAENADDEE